ncbi:MAG: hypothetical protein R3190_04300 [Thermoanaerobaculia bacterium]|nr:hypothetical protein [Thermoanaerobaculia bacterium]
MDPGPPVPVDDAEPVAGAGAHEWRASLGIESHGVVFAIRATDESALCHLDGSLPPSWRPADPARASVVISWACEPTGDDEESTSHELYARDEMVVRTRDLDVLLDHLESTIRFEIADGTSDWLFVHSGAVGWHRRAIIVPGASGSGKSHLVRALVDAGCTYYSDEFAVLDARGRVHPFPSPLALWQGSELRKERLTIDDLGCREGVEPLEVGVVLLARYREGAEWHPKLLTPARAVAAILASTVQSRHTPAQAADILARVADGAHCWSGDRGEAETVVRDVLAAAEREFGPSVETD